MNEDQFPFEFYNLSYTHDQIEKLLKKIDENEVLSKEQHKQLIEDIGLDNISTFDLNYYNLKNLPTIPVRVSQLFNDNQYDTIASVDLKIQEAYTLLSDELHRLNMIIGDLRLLDIETLLMDLEETEQRIIQLNSDIDVANGVVFSVERMVETIQADTQVLIEDMEILEKAQQSDLLLITKLQSIQNIHSEDIHNLLLMMEENRPQIQQNIKDIETIKAKLEMLFKDSDILLQSNQQTKQTVDALTTIYHEIRDEYQKLREDHSNLEYDMDRKFQEYKTVVNNELLNGWQSFEERILQIIYNNAMDDDSEETTVENLKALLSTLEMEIENIKINLELDLQTINWEIEDVRSAIDNLNNHLQEELSNLEENLGSKMSDELLELIDEELKSYMDTDEITYEDLRDDNTLTSYILTTIPYRDRNDYIINWQLSMPKVKDTFETPRQQALDNDFVVCLNAGPFTSAFKPQGILIKDGEILADNTNTTLWYLAINKETKKFESGKVSTTTAEQLVSQYDYVVSGFVPIIMNGQLLGDDILNDCPNGAVKHPRQILCQKKDGTVLIITSDGRRQTELGWTLKEAQTICQQYDVDFAFNLDGGGSAQTVYRGTLITQPVDNYHTEEREVGACLGFKLSEIKNEKDKDIKIISKMIGDLKKEIDYIKHYNVFDRGFIALKASNTDTNMQGIEVYDENIRTNRLQLSKNVLYYYKYNNITNEDGTQTQDPSFILRVGDDGLITTGFSKGYIQDALATSNHFENPDDINITGTYWYLSTALGLEGEDVPGAYALQHVQSFVGDAAVQIAIPYSSNDYHKVKRRRRNEDGTWLNWVNNDLNFNTNEIIESLLKDYATKIYVDDRIEDINIDIDLDDYATEEFVINKILEAQLNNKEVDLSGLATKTELNNKVDKVSGKSLLADSEITRLASLKNYDDTELRNLLNNKVDKINGKSLLSDTEIARLATLKNYDDTELRLLINQLTGNEIDLSGIATKAELNNKVDKVSGKSLLADTEITRLATLKNYDDTELRNSINNKVDKVSGKSLLADSEITRLASLKNYDDTELRNLIQTAENNSVAAINVHNYRSLVTNNDWTAAINKAIEVATANGSVNRRVYLPAGEYLTQGIALPSNIEFFGAGKKNTILKLIKGDKAVTRKCLITNNDWNNSNTNIHVRGMTLDYNGAYTQADKNLDGNGWSCLLFAYVTHSSVIDVYAKNPVLHCIDISSKEYDPAGSNTNAHTRPYRSSHILIENCEAEGGGDDNITTHHSDYITIRDCYSHDPAGAHFAVTDGHRKANTNCFEVDDGSRFVTVENCLGVGGYAGFEVKAHDYAPAASNVRLINCTARNNVRSFVCRHILEEEVDDKLASTSAFYIDIIGCTAIDPTQNDDVYYNAESFALRIYKYNNVNVSNFTAIGDNSKKITNPIYITNNGRHINLNNISISGFKVAENDIRITGSDTGSGKVNISNVVIRDSAKNGLYLSTKELSLINVKISKSTPVTGSIGIISGVNTTDLLGCVVEGYETMFDIVGRKVNTSLSRLRHGVVMASSSGIASHDQSAVIASTSDAMANGPKSFVIATSNGVANGERSAVITSSAGCEANAEKSVVVNSSACKTKADQANVSLFSSHLVESRASYTTLGGFSPEDYLVSSPSTANITWEIESRTGNFNSKGSFIGASSFADFAEMFENKYNEEIPVGYIVSLDGDKVIKADGDDILGVISKNAVLIAGDSTFCWQGRYLKGEFGETIYEEREFINEDGIAEILLLPVENKEYDHSLEYKSRSERKDEWSCVGLIGQVYTRIDGTVNVGDYLKANNGIGTKSDIKTNLRVMKITKEFDNEYGIALCILK